jgi:nitroimidazol reductase NimA-like FMN-containing flavoprotein (pyridoxamine 5'-phosphate oxidase superfamily)
MNTEEINAFLAKPNDAIIAINRSGKGAQLAPVWFFWDGEAFYFSTDKQSAKYLNMTRDANISVIVNETAVHTYVTAYGKVEFLQTKEVSTDLLRSVVEKYIPPEQRAQYASVINALNASASIVMVLRPDKIIGITSPSPTPDNAR